MTNPVYLPELDPRNQQQRFVKITYDGSSCIVRPHEVDDMLDGAEPSGYSIKDVWMSEAMYAKLPEFMGW